MRTDLQKRICDNVENVRRASAGGKGGWKINRRTSTMGTMCLGGDVMNPIQAANGSVRQIDELVQNADAAIRKKFATPVDGRDWNWTVTADREPTATLTMTYFGHSSTRAFSPEELRDLLELPGQRVSFGATYWLQIFAKPPAGSWTF